MDEILFRCNFKVISIFSFGKRRHSFAVVNKHGMAGFLVSNHTNYDCSRMQHGYSGAK